MQRILIRKGYRIIMGSLFPLLYIFTDSKIIPLSIIIFFLLLILIFEIERKKHPGLYPYVTSRWYGKIFKKEAGKILGTTYFLIGALIVITIFSKEASICALLFNVYGDAFSAIIGTKYGRIKFFSGKKSLEGSITFFAICFIIGIILIKILTISFISIIVGAIVATIIEFLSIKIDDNITIPIFTGLSIEFCV